MFVSSNPAEGLAPPPAQATRTATEQYARPEQYYEVMIRDVISAACNRPEGFSLHVGLRGHRSVSEDLTFHEGDLTDVQVRPDFSFVLIFRNQRFWTQSKEGNCAVIQRIQASIHDPAAFELPSSVSFSAGS